MSRELVQFLKSAGVRLWHAGEHEHARPGWVQADCPLCCRPGHARLGISLDRGVTNCWSCGPMRSGDTLAALTGKSVGECLSALRDVAPRKLLNGEKGSGAYRPPKGVQELLAQHKRYLRGRRIDVEKVQELWQVKSIGQSARLGWRLFIPVHCLGMPVSWTTRHIREDHEGRYISAGKGEEKMPLKSLLYGEDFAGAAIVVVEGPVDVWKIGPGAVCTFGTAWSKKQMLRIARFARRVVCFDKENAAQASARKLCRQLCGFDGETKNVVLDSKDPGEASAEELEELRALLR